MWGDRNCHKCFYRKKNSVQSFHFFSGTSAPRSSPARSGLRLRLRWRTPPPRSRWSRWACCSCFWAGWCGSLAAPRPLATPPTPSSRLRLARSRLRMAPLWADARRGYAAALGVDATEQEAKPRTMATKVTWYHRWMTQGKQRDERKNKRRHRSSRPFTKNEQAGRQNIWPRIWRAR